MLFGGYPTIYRGGDQTGKVRHLPDAPVFGCARPDRCRYRDGPPGVKMAVRFRLGSRCLSESGLSPAGRLSAAGARDRLAGRHSAPNPAFAAVADGYSDLARHLFAIETGRCSDLARHLFAIETGRCSAPAIRR